MITYPYYDATTDNDSTYYEGDQYTEKRILYDPRIKSVSLGVADYLICSQLK